MNEIDTPTAGIMTKSPFRLIIFVLFSHAVQAQPARFGIFEATADWGWEREYAPEKPWHKVPGKIEVSNTADGFMYDVFGNGAQLGANWEVKGFDLGYYVFVPQPGSTQFTAKVQLIDRGGESGLSMSGIMIRKDGKEASSEYYTLVHRFGSNEKIGIAAETSYRMNYGGRKFWGDIWNTERSVGTDTVYLRLTNNRTLQTVVAELSTDGKEWFPIDQTKVELGDTPDYGLMVCSQSYSRLLTHSQFSDIEVLPVTIYAERDMKQFYKTGKPFEIKLKLVNESDSSQPVQLVECLPQNWIFQSSSHSADVTDSKVVWDLLLEPGNTFISYSLIPPINKKESDRIYGHINNVITFGHYEIYPIKTEAWGTPRSDWRYWNSADGLLSRERTLYVGFDGTVITQKDRNHNFFRYDGYEFQTIPSLPHMHKIVENKEGKIWSIAYELDQDIRSFEFYGIYEFVDGQWIKLSDEIGFESSNFYFNFFPMGSAKLLIATNVDVVCFNTITKEYETIHFKDDIKPSNYFPHESVQTMDGTIWLGGSLENRHTFSLIPYIGNDMDGNGFPTLHPFQEEFNLRSYGFPVTTHDNIISFTYRLHNEERGAAKFDGETVTTLKQDTPPVETLLDHNGSLWLSKENESGLQQIDQQGNVQEYNNDFFVGGKLDLHIASKEGFWTATQDGIALNSPSIWQTPPEILGLNESIYSITEDNQNRVWFFSSHHLIRYDDKGWTLYQIPERYNFEDVSGVDYKLVQLKSGLLSIGPIQLFHRWRSIQRRWLFLYFDPDQERFIEKFVPEAMEAIAVEEGQDGEVIEITKPIDLKMYNRDDRNTSHYFLHSFDGLNQSKVVEVSGYPNLIYSDHKGYVWVSIENDSNTLIQYDAGTAKKYYLPDQITNSNPLTMIESDQHWILATGDCILQLAEDTFTKLSEFDGQKHEIEILNDGSLWVASDSGLIREQDQSWFENGYQDGLLSSTVYSIFEDSQHRIWAGTASGLSLYHPQMDSDVPDTRFSKETNIDEFTPGSEILLSYTGLDKWKKTESDRLLYSTKLDNSDWSQFSSATVNSATGLSLGNHTLFVRSMDRNGNIDPIPAEFGFSVQTPWYLHWGFISTVSLLLLYIVYRHISLERTVQLRTADLQHELQERHRLELMIQQISEREQKRVGQDLHDGLSQYLAGTLLLIRKMKNKLLSSQPKEAEKASVIEKFLEQSVQFTRNLVRGLSPISLDSQGLNDAISEFASHMKKLYEIDCTFVPQCEFTIQDTAVKTNIFRIVQESVNNAIKHGKANEIVITLTEIPGEYLITVHDNGEGFKENSSESSGFGMQIMQYRASLFNGKFKVNNQPGHGVCIYLHIPRNK